MFALAVAGDGGLRLYTLGVEAPQTGGGRGEVCGFSKASRRRLIDKLMLIPWKECVRQDPHAARASAVLLTLTYPREFPTDSDVIKRHLANFRRALQHIPDLKYSALWRLEYQKRGAAHFHIIMWFDRKVSIARFENWAKQTWARVVDSGDLLHVKHGADVRPITVSRRNTAALMAYLVKYLGKLADEQFHTGRIWGEWGSIPRVIRCAVSFETRAGYVEFLRRVRKWGRKSRYLRNLANVKGARLYCYGPSVLMQLASHLPGVDVYVG
jgi:hypothetical protein